jgi:hypothetical protein
MYFVFMYENRIMKPDEIILRGGAAWEENNGGDKSKMHCKHICKYHNVSPCVIIICYQ